MMPFVELVAWAHMSLVRGSNPDEFKKNLFAPLYMQVFVYPYRLLKIQYDTALAVLIVYEKNIKNKQ